MIAVCRKHHSTSLPPQTHMSEDQLASVKCQSSFPLQPVFIKFIAMHRRGKNPLWVVRLITVTREINFLELSHVEKKPKLNESGTDSLIVNQLPFENDNPINGISQIYNVI